jgi:anti-sigma B factor antagonist
VQAPPRPVPHDGGANPFARCGVVLHPSDGGGTLVVRGTLDGETLPALSAQIDQLLCTPCEEAVLDVRDLTVLDARGCRAVAGLAHAVAGLGGRLVIRTAPGAITGLLVSTGLGQYLEIERDAVA